VIATTFAIRSLSGELSRLEKSVQPDVNVPPAIDSVVRSTERGTAVPNHDIYVTQLRFYGQYSAICLARKNHHIRGASLGIRLQRFRLPHKYTQYSLGHRKYCDNDYLCDPLAQW